MSAIVMPPKIILDPEQRMAASHAGGPALVIAGPGAGKTRTLVARHRHRVESGVPLDRILVSTFTVKAADQLRSRIAEAHGGIAPEDARGMAIGTFHSICAKLLRKFHAAVGLPAKFQILDSAGQAALLHSLGIKFEGTDSDLIELIARWKDSRKSPADAAAEAAVRGDRDLAEAAEHYARYEDELLRVGSVDFADLIAKMIQAMSKEPTIARILQSRFVHVLVDEFQDVNALQITFIKSLLAGKLGGGAAKSGGQAQLWVVGDDDQAIYGWRGADVRFTTNFGQHFPGALVYKLNTNWRSEPSIVSASSSFVSANQMRIRKNLVAGLPKGVPDAVTIREFATDQDEAQWVANSCKTLLERGAQTSDLAVIFRTASISPLLERTFAQMGVPAVVQGSTPFWELPETRAVAGLIAMTANLQQVTLLHEAVKPGRRRQDLEIWAQRMYGTKFKDSALAAARAIGEWPTPGLTAERLGLWLDSTEQAANEAVRFATVEQFLAHIKAERAAPRSGDRDGIPLTTIHAAKGLEWQGIFVCGCEAHMMPHHRSTNIEEERRVLYVAMTRAKSFVSMSYARSRFSRSQSPSNFLHEIADRADPKLATVTWPSRPPKPSQHD